MFPELEGYEAAVPSKHDVAFMVDVALKEVRAALDDEPSLAPAVLGLVGGAREAFAARCGRALKRVPAARSAGFRTLGAAVDDACRGGVSAGDMVVPEVAWRASAVEERDARLVACAATLRRQAGDRLGLWASPAAPTRWRRASRRSTASGGRRVRGVGRELPRAVELAASRTTALGALDAPASPALVRALAALSGLRNGYFAALPCWPSPATESPPCSGCRASRRASRERSASRAAPAADADGARVDREREAWLDVLRCLDTWAQRASASGVSSLGDVYDAIHQDGEVLFDEYKAALLAAGK
ncbi:hypothetical protein JL720_14524 [Aureococcus anophagefferens]|nr:hypothetical protein JL720_14524 [Aureococcus anophagefferens]